MAEQEAPVQEGVKKKTSHFELIAVTIAVVLAILVRLDIFILSCVCAGLLGLYLYTEAFIGGMVAYSLTKGDLPKYNPGWFPTIRKVMLYTCFWSILWGNPILQAPAAIIVAMVLYTFVYARFAKTKNEPEAPKTAA